MKRYAGNIALILAAPAIALLAIALFGLFKVGLAPGPEASARTFAAAHPGPAKSEAEISKAGALPESLPAVSAKPEHGLLVPILMYHHVGDYPQNADPVRRDLTVSTADFSAEMAWLAQQKYHTVTLAAVYAAASGGSPLPDKPIAITFDDGYSDVFMNAVPVLLKYGFVGSFAVITKFPGLPDYASWNDIRQAQKQGMEIVSHTQDHFDGGNPEFNYDFIKSDLLGSRRDLRENLGSDTNILVYPFGHYTADYIRAAHDSGFVMGLTVAFGKRVDPANLMATPRVRVHGQETMEKFQELLLK